MSNIMMTTKQVAELMGVDGETVRRKARAFRVPCHNLTHRKKGESYYFERQIIERWLELGQPSVYDNPPRPRRKRRRVV